MGIPGLLIAAVLLAVGGCASAPAPRPSSSAPSEEVRGSLGRIGVHAGPTTASGEWNLPAKGAAEGAKRGAGVGFGSTLRGSSAILSPLGALVGGIAGAAAAESAEVVEQAETAIKAAFTAAALQTTLCDRVLQVARLETRHPMMPAAQLGGTVAPGTRPEEPPGSLDTALEIQVQRYGTKAAATPNPPVHLFFNAQVALRRVADGSVVYTQRFSWLSPGRPITAWAAAEGEAVRHALDGGLQALAERIVDVVFLVRSVP